MPSLTGNENGGGCMDLSNLKPDRPIGGYCHGCGRTCARAVLKDFAEHFGIGAKKRVILTVDQARWHMSEKLEVPEGIHLFPLPPYSPELQPAERLWPVV
ncbi:MAG: hypothetical protein F6K50_17420, partial [Moorea sp. SIO3I7]|nr:hypothetical protein [Moorena sp. SIO3I7]